MQLPITDELLGRYASGIDEAWEWRAVDLVVRYGSADDASALLPAFLADPGKREYLIRVFGEHGDVSMAEPLVAACLRDGRVQDGMSTTVLHVLGLLGYEPAERVLWDHIVGDGDHYEMRDACFGLVHLPCTGIRDEIERRLRKNVRSALFPEFLPILATKLDDPSWVDRLAAWGEGPASTDCNGGLILGLALLGGRDEFVRALWNPRWEAHGSGTGTDRYAYAGTRVLDLSIRELYGDLVTLLASDPDDRMKYNAVWTFASLLRYWLDRPWLGLRDAHEPAETCLELCDALLTWSTPNDNDSLTGLVDDQAVSSELHQLGRDLEWAASHELELQYFGRLAL